MPAKDARSRCRNAFIYDLRDLDVLLGGLVVTPGVTNANFYAMVEIIVIASSSFFLQNDSGEEVLRDAQPMSPGNYFVVADGTVQVCSPLRPSTVATLANVL